MSDLEGRVCYGTCFGEEIVSPTPIRLRLSRRKGFNLQATSRMANGLEAMSVTRAGRWGNPFRIGHGVTMRYVDGCILQLCASIKSDAEAVAWFRGLCESQIARNPAWYGRHFATLRGKNLACWCKLGAPCHADVLLEIANRPICEAVSQSAGAKIIDGAGVEVIDGDTLSLPCDAPCTRERLRFFGMDSPELSGPRCEGERGDSKGERDNGA